MAHQPRGCQAEQGMKRDIKLILAVSLINLFILIAVGWKLAVE